MEAAEGQARCQRRAREDPDSVDFELERADQYHVAADGDGLRSDQQIPPSPSGVDFGQIAGNCDQGERDRARDDFKRALKYNPNFSAAAKALDELE